MRVVKFHFERKFLKALAKLSPAEQKRVKEKLEIFAINPFDLRLKTHKLSGDLKDVYAFSIDYSRRIVFKFESPDVVGLVTLGTHEIYQKK